MSGRITVVIGGQYGSEGKGGVVASLTLRHPYDIAVRTGAMNAGHTVYYQGQAYKMQILPTAWVSPNTKLVLGAGAYLPIDILNKEIEMVNKAMPGLDVRSRLFIDYRCAVHSPATLDKQSTLDRHYLIGGTMKGCAQAVIDKIEGRRPDKYKDILAIYHLPEDLKNRMVDTQAFLNQEYDAGSQIIIEGTQGSDLDLHFGPYPYTTSRATSAANWLAECGLSPALNVEVVMVLRTYPIRVAGNSGPMEGEMSWVELAQEINDKYYAERFQEYVASHALKSWKEACRQAVYQLRDSGFTVPVSSDGSDLHTWSDNDRVVHRTALSELHARAWQMLDEMDKRELSRLFEMTTVTAKLRRIGRFDFAQARRTIQRERPWQIVLTFLNYEFPETWNKDGDYREWMPWPAWTWLNNLEKTLGVPIRAVTVGPEDKHYHPVMLEAPIR